MDGFEPVGPHRHPARLVGHARAFRDQPGLLRRDDVQHVRLVAGAEGSKGRAGACVDLDHQPVVALADPFDHLAVKRLPALPEQRLLGKPVLRIQDEDPGPRLVGLEVVRDHAGPLVRAGRTAEGALRHHHDKGAAILHRLELAAKQLRLRARLPGMGSKLGRRLVIAGQIAPAEIDAGRQHQPVPVQPRAVRKAEAAGRTIHVLGPGVDHLDPRRTQTVEAMRDAVPIPQPAEVKVREGAGHELLLRLNQGDPQVRVQAAQVTRRRRAPETAADDGHVGRRLRAQDLGQRKRPHARAHGQKHVPPRRPHDPISANQWASARIWASS